MWIWINRHEWQIHNIHRGSCGISLAPNKSDQFKHPSRADLLMSQDDLGCDKKTNIVGMTLDEHQEKSTQNQIVIYSN